ncbi:MAG TPA: DUF1648 domain-containing protein [Chthoniobacterales bacterium]
MRKSLETAALVLLCLTWGWTIEALFGSDPLPAQIPVHFDLAGRPDRWGSPQMLWLIPVMTALIYSLMTLVARYPSAFNFPMRIKPAARPRLESIALHLISWLKVEVVGLFFCIQYEAIQYARNRSGELSPAFLPLVLVVIFGTIAWHIIAMRRVGRA